MTDLDSLIPPAPIVREQLARNIRERRILRSLLQLAIRSSEIDSDELGQFPPKEQEGRAAR